ncbi:protoglobin domain-containing protein [Natrialbaceae archaeon A-gly3]
MEPREVFGQGRLNDHVDPDQLLEDVDINPEEIAWRKDFIGFDEDDARRLSELEPLFRDHGDDVADRFYQNLTADTGALEILGRSPKSVEGLKEAQRAYLVSLATGEYDEDYFRERARIGKLHELLDMPMKYYVGQYGVYYDLILSLIDDRIQRLTIEAIEEWVDKESEGEGGFQSRVADRIRGFTGGDEDDADGLDATLETTVRESIHDGMADVLAVLRVINLDMQVAADTYFESYSQDLEVAIERRKALAYEVEREVQEPIEDLDVTSRSVAESAQKINDLAAAQAEDMHSVTEEVQSLDESAEEISKAADRMAEVSDQAEALAKDGVERADKALEELAAVEEATEEITGAVSQLEERTEAIDTVVDHIDELAERARLLGVNASTEARKSDGGETLEIIAQEVESFADQAKRNLDLVEEELEGIEEAAEETVETVETTTERLSRSVERVEGIVTDFDSIHEGVATTSQGIDDVADAVTAQAGSIQAIHRTVKTSTDRADRVSSETESVAAATEEQTATLSEIADTLGKLATTEDLERRPVYQL